MQRACIQWGGAAAAAVLALLIGAPVRAADNSAMTPVAEELGQRTKPAAAPEAEQKGGLSDSAVRVLMTYALSIIPDTFQDLTASRSRWKRATPTNSSFRSTTRAGSSAPLRARPMPRFAI